LPIGKAIVDHNWSLAQVQSSWVIEDQLYAGRRAAEAFRA
jgi:hypothetical protein